MSRSYIRYPLIKGRASRQAHADMPANTYEREMSKEGFFGPATFFHHLHPPTGWTSFDGPLCPRAFDLKKIPEHRLLWDAPVIFSNAHTEVRSWQLASSMKALVRNADGDQLLFVHAGSGHLFCDFGHLELAAGDYVVVPRGTMWRIETAEPMHLLAIEATNSSFTLPDKGLLGNHALFDPAILDTPALDDAFRAQQSSSRETQVKVKARSEVSTITYPFNPLDCVGWHGDLSVCRLNVKDIRPVMSHRYHLPPSAHTTFLADRLIIGTFVPRPFETDSGALKVPFFHNNDDFDEVIFYHAGEFFSRDNIKPGMMTFHPSGFTHGPHPKALSRMLVQTKSATDEYAVMIDARDALKVGKAAEDAEWTDYKYSWKVQA